MFPCQMGHQSNNLPHRYDLMKVYEIIEGQKKQSDNCNLQEPIKGKGNKKQMAKSISEATTLKPSPCTEKLSSSGPWSVCNYFLSAPG